MFFCCISHSSPHGVAASFEMRSRDTVAIVLLELYCLFYLIFPSFVDTYCNYKLHSYVFLTNHENK